MLNLLILLYFNFHFDYQLFLFFSIAEYLKENNEMMKKQFETLSQWKQKVHDANVLNREKFEQTRALITALRTENEELQTTIKDSHNKEVRHMIYIYILM